MMEDTNIVNISLDEFRSLMREQAEAGADAALEKIGLDDPAAGDDIRDLREVLKSWRQVKSGALKQLGAHLTTFILGAIVLFVAVKTGFIKLMVKP